MLKAFQKLLTIVFLTLLVLFLSYQGFLYYRARDKMPVGMTVAGVDVAGLTLEEVEQAVTARYTAPIRVVHRTEEIDMNPADVGFVLDMEAMLREADEASQSENEWQAFAEFVIGRSMEPVAVELHATHDREELRRQVEMLASFMDQPATGPRLVPETESYLMGMDGFLTDIEASFPAVELALYEADLEQRTAELITVDEKALPFDMTLLEESINGELQAFDGLGSIYILNLETGEELGINADVAVSGLSVVKIAILLETFRAIDSEPNSDELKLLNETGINSGNYSANLLLDIVAGQDNAYLGVDILTESMQRLGLENTFIVTPYEEPDRPGRGTLSTPANQRQDVYTNPDPTMQTTAEDMGTLLAMVYYCAEGGGALLALYPEQLTPTECQAVIDIMAQNVEGNLIRFGVPEGLTVAHKHGWAGNTHGDAGIVYSEGANYVIVEYLAQPNTDWLIHDISFPILREISREVYNHFNIDAPYFPDPVIEEESVEPTPETGAMPEAIPEGEATEEAPPANDGGLPPGVEASCDSAVQV